MPAAGERVCRCLGTDAAARLATIAESFDTPPQTPVVIAVGMHRNELFGHAADPHVREALRRFVERATNEERFAAEHAILAGGGATGGELARVALTAAVGLRPFAQERVWFPGFGGPSTRELEDSFGLAAINFDDVPPGGGPITVACWPRRSPTCSGCSRRSIFGGSAFTSAAAAASRRRSRSTTRVAG